GAALSHLLFAQARRRGRSHSRLEHVPSGSTRTLTTVIPAKAGISLECSRDSGFRGTDDRPEGGDLVETCSGEATRPMTVMQPWNAAPAPDLPAPLPAARIMGALRLAAILAATGFVLGIFLFGRALRRVFG